MAERIDNVDDLPTILRAAASAHPVVREAAVYALGRVSAVSPDAFAMVAPVVLLMARDDSSPAVRDAAADVAYVMDLDS